MMETRDVMHAHGKQLLTHSSRVGFRLSDPGQVKLAEELVRGSTV